MNPTLGLGLLLLSLPTVKGLLQPSLSPKHHVAVRQAQAWKGRQVAQELAKLNTEFGLKLFKKLASSSPGKNIIFSPLSVSTIFSMLCLGAQDSTLDEIRQALNIKKLLEKDVHAGFHYLIRKLKQSFRDQQLTLGNAMFIDQRLRPRQKFLTDLKSLYNADAVPTNFQNLANAEKQINDYVSRKTQGKVNNLVRNISPGTVMLLLNYIFLRARWLREFDPKLTKEGDFMLSQNKSVKVPMMFHGGMYKMGHDDQLSCTVLEMPYHGNLTALFILPDKGKLKQVEQAMQMDTVVRWRRLAKWRVVDVSLPKLSIAGTYDLKKTLSQMGMTKVFEDYGDLTRISPDRNLKVGEAIHKAGLKIDERGSEAAASSGMETMPMETPTNVKINSVFFVIIYEETTVSMIFLGRINDPTETNGGNSSLLQTPAMA
ncbi:serpin A12 [Choloepus didactylus]|uniref:serpin A12 n=1 Tax=Choloepus didactylus TaxID=27675 RepID=UPI00189C6881|nr:serpin A12 [Choloepus didactylus]XP_037691175.1 serpin A12 [Choloepus didactylus]XP_037691176.1 serpin A12 [Choloepus didactylus]